MPLPEFWQDSKTKVYLGNLEARRDLGYAPEYVEAMWSLLQHDHADDYVIGTGDTHAVREFVEVAFAYVGLEWQKYLGIDLRYFRPTEVYVRQADATRARVKLDWEPQVTFKELIAIMVDADMEALDLRPVRYGYQILTAKLAGWHRWSAAVTSLHHKTQRHFE